MVVARSKFGMVTHVGEGEAPFLEGQIWPLSQGVGPQHPRKFLGPANTVWQTAIIFS